MNVYKILVRNLEEKKGLRYLSENGWTILTPILKKYGMD
jgi:hypothetical protein